MNEVILELNKFLNHVTWLDIDNLNFEENSSSLIYTKKCNSIEAQNIINYNFENLFSIFKSSFKINLSHINEPKPFIIEENFNINYANEYIEEIFIAHKTINVELNINKVSLIEKIFKIEIHDKFNIKLFFSDKNFLKFINQLSYKDLENKIFSQLKKTIIVILNKKILMNNDLVLIIGGSANQEIEEYILNKIDSNIDTNKYKKSIQMRNEQCNWIESTKWLCPEYLYFNSSTEGFYFTYEINQYFFKKTVNLILAFISNYTNKEDEIIYSYINGYKKIKIQYVDNVIYENKMVYFLFKQYSWAYNGNNSDKLSMLRNLMTIFLCEECENSYYQVLLCSSEDIYKSVQNNFDIYLKNNVKEYFTETHRVREMISDKLKEVSNETNDLIGNMSKNFLTTIGVILGAAIGYLTKMNIYILKVAAIAYGIFILLNAILTVPYYKKRVNEINDNYLEHIDMFKKIVLPKHMPQIGIQKNITNFKIYWISYIVINVIILVITVLFILQTNFFVNLIKYLLK